MAYRQLYLIASSIGCEALIVRQCLLTLNLCGSYLKKYYQRMSHRRGRLLDIGLSWWVWEAGGNASLSIIYANKWYVFFIAASALAYGGGVAAAFGDLYGWRLVGCVAVTLAPGIGVGLSSFSIDCMSGKIEMYQIRPIVGSKRRKSNGVAFGSEIWSSWSKVGEIALSPYR
jgi:hypothetical protein